MYLPCVAKPYSDAGTVGTATGYGLRRFTINEAGWRYAREGIQLEG